MASSHLETRQAERAPAPSDGEEKPEDEKVHRLRVLLTQARKYAEFLVGQIEEQKVATSVDDGPSTRTKRRRKMGAATEDSPTLVNAFEQPRLLTGTRLRKYQLEGVQWLVSLYENGLNGILADEMGLGKTVECIGFLAFLRERGVLGPFLIVAPLSTLPNWACEIKRFAPSIPTLLYHGTPLERETLRRERFPFPSVSGSRAGVPISLLTPRDTAVIITSYELAMKDARYLAPIPWKYMMIDEGHRLKNMNCRLIRELKHYNSSNRLLLTGTPFHNNLTELWSLLNFLLPHIFSDLEDFLSWFDIDIELTKEADRTEILGHLHAILKPLLLRRLKCDVEEELPVKREYILSVRLTPLQCQYYQMILEGRARELVFGPGVDDETNKAVDGRITRGCRADYAKGTPDQPFDAPLGLEGDSQEDEGGTAGEGRGRPMDQGSRSMRGRRCVSNTGEATLSDPQGLQDKFMQLRKVCNHPYLFRYPVIQKDDGDELLVNEDIVQVSGKMRLLDQLLTALLTHPTTHHKILIFSQMTRQLDILAEYLEWRSLSYCRIDGGVPISERQEQINRFNGDLGCRLFLLSTRAGGLGINLTAADTVIFYDSDWNPQMDLQAQDRVHRIGQNRPVLVLRLVSTPSIETQLLERAGEKRKLERLIINKRKFKGRQQLLEQEEHDQLLVQELEEIINSNKLLFSSKDGDRRRIVVPTARNELTAVELRAILDRTPEALSSPPFSSDSVRPVTY